METTVSSIGLPEYYRRRAAEYDAIYSKPERQADIATLGAKLASLVAGQRILEVACGTGFWTRHIAQTARQVLATDINQEVLRIARERLTGFSNVQFVTAYAFTLAEVAGEHSASLAVF